MRRPASLGLLARALAGAGLCALAAGCARGVFVPPAGPGQPAPDAAAAWAEATGGCGDLASYSAALRVSGQVGGQRLWPIGIEAALRADQAIYLGATASGRGLFVLAGTGEQATLWLRREERRVTASPAAILDAVIGVAVAPSDLLGILTGCVAGPDAFVAGTKQGGFLRIDTARARVYLERRNGRWQTRAAETDAFTVEYAAFRAPSPRELWLWPPGGGAAALRLTIDDARVNEPLPSQVFTPPAGAAAAAPMTLDELKAGTMWKNRGSPSERYPWPEP